MTGKATHGHRRGKTKDGKRASTREYRAWFAMIARCENPKNDRYARYGGRGIKVCDAWHTFENFLSDVGRAPSEKHQIDRYPNNDGDYEPGNCRWATAQEQANRRSNNRFIEYNGETLTVAQWARRVGISRCAMQSRIDRDWPMQVAMDPNGKMRPPPKAKPVKEDRRIVCEECGVPAIAIEIRSRFCSQRCRKNKTKRDHHNMNRDAINARRRARHSKESL